MPRQHGDLLRSCLLSVEIKHSIIRAYLSASGGSAHMRQTHLCAGTEFVLKLSAVLKGVIPPEEKDSMLPARLCTAVEVQCCFRVELLNSVCGWVVFLLIQVPLQSLTI